MRGKVSRRTLNMNMLNIKVFRAYVDQMGARLQRLKAGPKRNGGIDLLAKVLSQMVQGEFVQRRRLTFHIRLVDQVDGTLLLQTGQRSSSEKQTRKQNRERRLMSQNVPVRR